MKTESILEYLSVVDDYNDITELNINRFNIVGEILEVDLSDLNFFPKLRKLCLNGISLELDDLKNISSINELEMLELHNCDINVNSFFEEFNNMNCCNLLLDNTYVDFSKIDKKYNEIILRDVVEVLGFDCNILDISKTNFNIKYIPESLKKLIVSKKQYDINKDFLKNLNVDLIVKNDIYDEVEEVYE